MSMNTVELLDKLFPAHAGVILLCKLCKISDHAFPRPRGGDPHGGVLGTVIHHFSPPTRG